MSKGGLWSRGVKTVNQNGTRMNTGSKGSGGCTLCVESMTGAWNIYQNLLMFLVTILDNEQNISQTSKTYQNYQLGMSIQLEAVQMKLSYKN